MHLLRPKPPHQPRHHTLPCHLQYHCFLLVTVLLLVRNIVAAAVLVVVGAATEISALQSSLATLASVVATAILLTVAFH